MTIQRVLRHRLWVTPPLTPALSQKGEGASFVTIWRVPSHRLWVTPPLTPALSQKGEGASLVTFFPRRFSPPRHPAARESAAASRSR